MLDRNQPSSEVLSAVDASSRAVGDVAVGGVAVDGVAMGGVAVIGVAVGGEPTTTPCGAGDDGTTGGSCGGGGGGGGGLSGESGSAAGEPLHVNARRALGAPSYSHTRHVFAAQLKA